MFFNQHIFLFILFILFLALIGSVSAADKQVLEFTNFVNQGPPHFIYFYNVYSTNGNILINIQDYGLNNQTITFDKPNNLQFRAANYKFIILQQKNGNDTLNYWVIKIEITSNGFNLKSFPVNSTFDSLGYEFGNDYTLSSIIEYNQFDNTLYVIMQGANDTNIYGIDIANQGKFMTNVGWFNINNQNPENIVGVNSRVLVQATNDQLWVDTRNAKANISAQPTIYNKTNIKDLTKLPIYPGGSKVFDLIDSYFEYVSVSSDQTKMTAFVYYGYGDQSIQGQVNIITFGEKIKTFSDGHNYFVAVGDQDMYITVVEYNQTLKNYSSTSNTLVSTKPTLYNLLDTIQIFRAAVQVVYNNHKLYVLTPSNFYVYGGDTYFTRLFVTDLDESIPSLSDTQRITLQQINDYQKTH